jgi:hypothetical protein
LSLCLPRADSFSPGFERTVGDPDIETGLRKL